jgi:hypothetical protein
MRSKKLGFWMVAIATATMPFAAPVCDPSGLNVVLINPGGWDDDDDWDFNGLYWENNGDKIWPFEFWEFDELFD